MKTRYSVGVVSVLGGILLVMPMQTSAFNIGLGNGGGDGHIRVEIPPKDGQADVLNNNQEFITPDVASDSLIKAIQLTNETLRIILAPVLLASLLYAGYLMITAQGDPGKFKKGIWVLIYVGVGIGVLLLAYVIINIVVNIF